MATTAELKRTPLYQAHVEAGAKLVPFAGWEMPVQYQGIRQEHLAVRSGCGVFDVSHMGEIETEGPQAAELLQRLLSNDVSKIEVGGAQYSCLCREDGGVLDDLFTYRLGDHHFLTVTNAANHERDFEWFRRHADDFDADVHDRIDDYAMLAVQGPEARRIVGSMAQGELPAGSTPPTSTSAPATPSSAGPATPARTGSRSSPRRMRRPRCGRSSSSAAPPRLGSGPATPCGWRSTTASTATI